MAKLIHSRNRRSKQLTHWLALEHLEAREVPAVVTFQQGVAGYGGTQDTVLFNQTPNTTYGLDSFLNIDQQDVSGVRQGLMRFDGIIGSNPGQIPLGSTINSATLTLNVTNESNSTMVLSFYRMLANWNEASVTWNNFNAGVGMLGGVQSAESESASTPDTFFLDPSISTEVVDVKTSIQAWALGDTNYGWFIESGSTNGIDIESSNAASNQPLLTVDFTPPSGGSGRFIFSNPGPALTEGDSGDKIFNLPVGWVGNTGLASVNYSVTASTAASGVDFTLANGTLNFDSATKTHEQFIPIIIHSDTDIEGPETVTITLSAPSGGIVPPGLESTTFTIADDDLLINEVFANVSKTSASNPDETNFEYIELLGAANKSIPAGTYFVVFEGEEEEASGTVLAKNGVGRADLVIDLSGKTFGSNGLMVITPTTWNYASSADPATVIWGNTQLNKTGGVLEDSSQTYAIIMSPSTIVEGTDYDTTAYTGTSSEETGLGIGVVDAMPLGARFVDSVGYNEGGSGDRDRIVYTAHPGVRIFQPEGFSEGSTPDGISRLAGFRDPNNNGAWFNGDITSAAAKVYAPRPQAYANNPLGAAITPGASNTLPVINFKVTSAAVNETAGTVNLLVQRGGISNVEAKVNFATANGSAIAGQDYTATAGTLTFAPGDNEETITISLTNDVLPEANEFFRVTLSGATAPFVVDGNLNKMEITLLDNDAITKSFQDGFKGYAGTSDTYLTAWSPSLVNGADTDIILDTAYRNGFVGNQDLPTQALLKFDNVFGAGSEQVPVGAQIFGGFVRLFVTNFTSATAEIRFHTMLQDWDEGATWTNPQGGKGSAILNGINPDDVEASARADMIVPFPDRSQYVDIPINVDTLQAWSNGTAANYGWLMTTDSDNEYLFNTSEEFFDPTARPQLFVAYQQASGLGTFRIGTTETIINEDGTAQIPILRVNGIGATSVKYSITPTTGSASDITGALTGTIPFAANTISTYLTIPSFNDGLREASERFTITIESDGTPLTIDRATSTLTIRDNDYNPADPAQRMLFNEIYLNSPGNDAPHEYAEFVGAPGVGLGSLFFMTIEGDAGIIQGSTQVVADISTIYNGGNGHTIITSIVTPGYAIDPGATRVPDNELEPTNTNQARTFRDNSGSYVLIYSPTATISVNNHDYDWNNDGTLELPVGAVIVDGAATLDDTGSDRIYLFETGTTPATMAISKAQGTSAVIGPDLIARHRGNTTPKLPAGFFSGDLINNGDDPLLLQSAASFGLPVTGASGTPGYANPGAAAESPLVSLTSVGTTFGAAQRSRITGLTLNYNGVISNVLGIGGSGIPALSITDQSGNPLVGISISKLDVTGLASNSITVKFSGNGLENGSLPDGKYRLTIRGNSVIGNGRAADNANSGAAAGSDFNFNFHRLFGDGDGNGTVDGVDLGLFGATFGLSDSQPGYLPGFDFDNNNTIDAGDLAAFGSRFGFTI